MGTAVGGSYETGLGMIGRGQGGSLSDPNYAGMQGKQTAGQFGAAGQWDMQGFMGKSQQAIDPSLSAGLGLGLGVGLNLISDPNNPSMKMYNPSDPALKGLGVGVFGGGAGASVLGKN